MATIRRRGDGQYQVQVRKHGYPPISNTFMVKADAVAWARRIETQMDRGLYLPTTATEKTTLADLADRFERSEVPKKRAQAHFQNCLKRLRTSSALGKGQRAIATLTSMDAANFRDDLLEEGLADSTVRKMLFFMATLVDFGVKNMGLIIQANPFRMISRPPEPRHRDRRLQNGEEERLREAIRGTRQAVALEALFTLALETGARLGELLALEWEEVDLAKQVMTLRGREVGGKRQLKNAELLRYSPLSPAAVAALQRLPRPIKGGRVFEAWARSDSFTHQWQRVCKAAGVEGLRFHDLRHEFASRVAPRVEMHVLMKLLGHKSPAMVARYYNQTADDVSALAKRLYGTA